MLSRLTHNWTLKLTSLVLAVALWSHVRGEVNPLETGTFRVRLRADVPREVIVAEGGQVPAWVQVTLRAPRQTLRDLKGDAANPLAGSPTQIGDALRASLDWSGLKVARLARGEQNVPVKAVSPSPDAEVLGVKPADVRLSLDRAARRTMPLSPVLRPNPAPFFEAEALRSSPSRVEISGPNALLARVHRVEARADIGTPSSGALLVDSATLVAVDERGRKLEGIRVEPKSARVEAILRENHLTRRALVRVEVRGQPAPGFRVAGVEATPPRLRLSGPQRLLGGVREVSAVVEIAGASQTVRQSVHPNLPRGVTASRQTVLVRVRLERVPTDAKASDVPVAETASAAPDASIAERDLPEAAPQASPPAE